MCEELHQVVRHQLRAATGPGEVGRDDPGVIQKQLTLLDEEKVESPPALQHEEEHHGYSQPKKSGVTEYRGQPLKQAWLFLAKSGFVFPFFSGAYFLKLSHENLLIPFPVKKMSGKRR